MHFFNDDRKKQEEDEEEEKGSGISHANLRLSQQFYSNAC